MFLTVWFYSDRIYDEFLRSLTEQLYRDVLQKLQCGEIGAGSDFFRFELEYSAQVGKYLKQERRTHKNTIRDGIFYNIRSSVPEFIDPVFAKTSQKCSFSVIQNERFELVFANTGYIISGTGFCQPM